MTRYECPRCGAGGACEGYIPNCHQCKAGRWLMMEPEKTPFGKWWEREGKQWAVVNHLNAAEVRSLCHTAWYNGAYMERYRLHVPRMAIGGTETGRFSADKPNVSNDPKS